MRDIDLMKIKKDGYGRNRESVDYWLNNRKKLSDLYKSEIHFFGFIKLCDSVLDIGCAAGGSALFTREAKTDINYVGIDVSRELVQAAATNFSKLPNTKFLHFDGLNIPLQDHSIDFVFSFGVFHHLNYWQDILSEALRVSSKYVLFDLRLWPQDSFLEI
jgi:SAM-dependent methyltransferase